MQLGVAKEATCNIKKLSLIKEKKRAEQGGSRWGLIEVLRTGRLSLPLNSIENFRNKFIK